MTTSIRDPYLSKLDTPSFQTSGSKLQGLKDQKPTKISGSTHNKGSLNVPPLSKLISNQEKELPSFCSTQLSQTQNTLHSPRKLFQKKKSHALEVKPMQNLQGTSNFNTQKNAKVNASNHNKNPFQRASTQTQAMNEVGMKQTQVPTVAAQKDQNSNLKLNLNLSIEMKKAYSSNYQDKTFHPKKLNKHSKSTIDSKIVEKQVAYPGKSKVGQSRKISPVEIVDFDCFAVNQQLSPKNQTTNFKNVGHLSHFDLNSQYSKLESERQLKQDQRSSILILSEAKQRQNIDFKSTSDLFSSCHRISDKFQTTQQTLKCNSPINRKSDCAKKTKQMNGFTNYKISTKDQSKKGVNKTFVDLQIDEIKASEKNKLLNLSQELAALSHRQDYQLYQQKSSNSFMFTGSQDQCSSTFQAKRSLDMRQHSLQPSMKINSKKQAPKTSLRYPAQYSKKVNIRKYSNLVHGNQSSQMQSRQRNLSTASISKSGINTESRRASIVSRKESVQCKSPHNRVGKEMNSTMKVVLESVMMSNDDEDEIEMKAQQFMSHNSSDNDKQNQENFKTLKLNLIQGRVKDILEQYELKVKALTLTVEELSQENKILKRKLFQQANTRQNE